MFITINFPFRTAFTASYKFWYVVFSFSFVSRYFFISPLISVFALLVVLVPAPPFSSFLLFRPSPLSWQILWAGRSRVMVHFQQALLMGMLFCVADRASDCPMAFGRLWVNVFLAAGQVMVSRINGFNKQSSIWTAICFPMCFHKGRLICHFPVPCTSAGPVTPFLFSREGAEPR